MTSSSNGSAIIFDQGKSVAIVAPPPLITTALDFATQQGMTLAYPGGFLSTDLCWCLLWCCGQDPMSLEATGLHCSVPERIVVPAE